MHLMKFCYSSPNRLRIPSALLSLPSPLSQPCGVFTKNTTKLSTGASNVLSLLKLPVRWDFCSVLPKVLMGMLADPSPGISQDTLGLWPSNLKHRAQAMFASLFSVVSLCHLSEWTPDASACPEDLQMNASLLKMEERKRDHLMMPSQL
jgi:hypothetical protein